MIAEVLEFDTAVELQQAIDAIYDSRNVIHIECLSHNSKLILVIVTRDYAG